MEKEFSAILKTKMSLSFLEEQIMLHKYTVNYPKLLEIMLKVKVLF